MKQNHIGNLIELASELSASALAIISEKQSLEQDDHFGLMILTFTIRQYQHLESILSLIETQNYRDTALIARAMIEEFAYLRWTSENPDERAYRWRAFSWLTDFYNLVKKEQSGEKVDVAYKRRVETEIDRHKQVLLKPKYRKVRERDIPLEPEKRYIKEWFIDEKGACVRLEDVIKSSPNGNTLWNAYQKTSKRVHAQLEDIKIKWENGEAKFVEQRKIEAWGPCSVAMFSLRVSLDTFTNHLNLNYKKELGEFDSRFQKFSKNVAET